jgi:hypothetical protein
MEKIGTTFRKAVERFAADNTIPVVRFGKGNRKIDLMRGYVAAQARTGRSGVAAIGVAQELQNVFAAAEHHRSGGPTGLQSSWPTIPAGSTRSRSPRCCRIPSTSLLARCFGIKFWSGSCSGGFVPSSSNATSANTAHGLA